MIKVTRHLLVLTCSIALGCVGCNDAEAAGPETDNAVIVLDASGSMDNKLGGTKLKRMDAAKQAIAQLLKTLPTTTHVGLVVFSGNNKKSDWVHHLGPRNDAVLLQKLTSIQPGGGTPLGSYMKIGADVLLTARNKQYGYGSYKLLIITDGDASGDGEERRMKQYAPEIVARGITMDAIGVDMGKEHFLSKASNSYRSASDPKALAQAMKQVFAEVEAGGDIQAMFDELEGIPDGVARTMIQSLGASGNHPIGAKPRPKLSKVNKQVMDAAVAETDSGLGVGAIIGIALGVVVMVIAGGCVVANI